MGMNLKSRLLSLPLAIVALGSIPAAERHPIPPLTPNACAEKPAQYATFGTIERLDPKINELIPADARIEKLADGFVWAEGPVWVIAGQYLLFSDVPENTVYKWKEDMGVSIFLRPSGYTGRIRRRGEPGSNGLTLDHRGRLVLCQHGDRRVARLDDNGAQTVLAEFYKWRRFNSPNDLVFRSNGDLYFTDPPYGLEAGNRDPNKELMFNGVYRRCSNGQIALLTAELTFPNGLAFSPDEGTLYVAQSDPTRPIIMAYPVQPDGTLGPGRVFFNAATLAKNRPGLPDGLKLDQEGNLFATGPGGVLILSPEGKHLGTINTGLPTANCAWGDDGSTLYITANHCLARVRTSTCGAAWPPSTRKVAAVTNRRH
jgi:gluconolactonase